jgi:hypothetical protein
MIIKECYKLFNLEKVKQRENKFRELLNTDKVGQKFLEENFDEIQQYLDDQRHLLKEIERLQHEIVVTKPVHLKERKGKITKIKYLNKEYAVIHPTAMRAKAKRGK